MGIEFTDSELLALVQFGMPFDRYTVADIKADKEKFTDIFSAMTKIEAALYPRLS